MVLRDFAKKTKFHVAGGPGTVILPIVSWAEPQYLDRLHHEILFLWQKSLRTIHTYHLVPFKLPKNVQGGPFQGLLVFNHFFPKIAHFTKYALTPSFFGRPSSVIPFRKALAIPVAGPYWSLS